jgi:hypothetical protein
MSNGVYVLVGLPYYPHGFDQAISCQFLPFNPIKNIIEIVLPFVSIDPKAFKNQPDLLHQFIV